MGENGLFRVSKYLLVAVLFVGFAGESIYVTPKLSVKSQKASPLRGTMARKLSRLLGKIEEATGCVELSLNEYRELVFDPPRNHTVFALFYNDAQICQSCEAVIKTFDKVARSFLLSNTKFDEATSSWTMQAAVFFVKTKLTEDYQLAMVELDPSVPGLYYFAPTQSLKYNNFEEINQNLVSDHGVLRGEKIVQWIEGKVDLKITLEDNSKSLASIASILIFGVVCVLVVFNLYHYGYWDSLVEAIKQYNFAYTITVVILYFLSGQMFNYIRNTPMIGNNGFSLSSIIYPGMRWQYGCESVIVMLIYALIIYGVLQLVESREGQLNGYVTRREFQSSAMAALSCVYFGFMLLQYFSQLKTGR